MALLFLDTSALMKLYLLEKGSNWVRGYVVGNQISISELAFYESISVLRRLNLEGTLTYKQATALYSKIRKDSQNYSVVFLGVERQLPRFVRLSFKLSQNLRLRALDGIQMAAAEVAREAANKAVPPVPFVFVSSDQNLLNVAKSYGFTTENPENYP